MSTEKSFRQNNRKQMATQNESSNEWQADRYAQHAHFVPALGQPVLDLLQPQPGERILDLGCGDGVLTEKIAAPGACRVGVTGGPAMVAAAPKRAAAPPGIARP